MQRRVAVRIADVGSPKTRKETVAPLSLPPSPFYPWHLPYSFTSLFSLRIPSFVGFLFQTFINSGSDIASKRCRYYINHCEDWGNQQSLWDEEEKKGCLFRSRSAHSSECLHSNQQHTGEVFGIVRDVLMFKVAQSHATTFDTY